jgi:recombination protein RecA
VAALVPRAEIEGEMGDAHVGLQARLMSQALRKLTATVSKSRTCVIFINQIREKIGGRALKFYSSVRLDVRRIEGIKDGAEFIGNRVRAKVVKNKCAPPFRTAEFDLMYSRGISKEGSLLDVAVENGVVHKSGAWYTYNEEQIGQGRENAKAFLAEHMDVADEIERKIKAALAAAAGGDVPPPDEPPPVEENGDNGNGNIGEDLDKVVANLTAKAGATKKK